MFKKLIEFFFGRKAPEAPVAETKQSEAPYKVEPPVVTPMAVPPEPVKCGCGRSPTGYCTGLHKLSQAEWEAHPDNPVKPAAEAKPAKKAPAKKKPAAIKAAPKKATAKKTTSK